MRISKMFMTVLALVFSSAAWASGEAEGTDMPKAANPLQCVEAAKRVAKALDAVNQTDYASREISAESTVEYLDSVQDYAQYITYRFGAGESYLEVQMQANAYKLRSCLYRSSAIIVQE
ncbi:MAG: hypothetical protein ACK5Y2_09750 [Bdellovibrionales bacterium]